MDDLIRREDALVMAKLIDMNRYMIDDAIRPDNEAEILIRAIPVVNENDEL